MNDLTELLNTLDAARDKATAPGRPWRQERHYVIPFRRALITTSSHADAALIVAAVNALPRLTAALRAAWNADATEVALSGIDYVRHVIAVALSEPTS